MFLLTLDFFNSLLTIMLCTFPIKKREWRNLDFLPIVACSVFAIENSVSNAIT